MFTAPSNHEDTVLIEATMPNGASVNLPFEVLEPNGHGYAEITGTNHYSVGIIGAGMTVDVWLYPREVCLNRVSVMELNCGPTNITGYYTNFSVGGHVTGNYWIPLDDANAYTDGPSAILNNPSLPLYPGGFDTDIPVKWQITGSLITNDLTHWIHSSKLLEVVSKFTFCK